MNANYIDISMGSFLKDEFLIPLNLSQNSLAKAIGVPSGRINQIVNNKRKITADTDLRLCRYFGMQEGFFLKIQYDIDIILVKRLIKNDLQKIIPMQQNNNIKQA